MVIGLDLPIVSRRNWNSENSFMISIKHVIAALALGPALLVAPTTATAKTLHPAAKVHTLKKHAKTMHRTTAKHTALHATHTKSKALSPHQNQSQNCLRHRRLETPPRDLTRSQSIENMARPRLSGAALLGHDKR